MLLIFPTLLIGISYYIVGFNPGVDHFFKAIACGILLSWLGFTFGIFMGSAFKNGRLAFELIPLVIFPMLLFSGLMANLGKINRLALSCI